MKRRHLLWFHYVTHGGQTHTAAARLVGYSAKSENKQGYRLSRRYKRELEDWTKERTATKQYAKVDKKPKVNERGTILVGCGRGTATAFAAEKFQKMVNLSRIGEKRG
ncbi:hypothetical protein FACS18949_13350 [Clostridia bacterium]|nr:hypothetical protein FACS189425_06930 [Clostridia bacterium]GHV35418.1 hypothetical protein FACS18949_13350 [Clostridia bacterium]